MKSLNAKAQRRQKITMQSPIDGNPHLVIEVSQALNKFLCTTKTM